MKTNTKTFRKISTRTRTHGGGYSESTNYENLLRRSVMSCLLWEDEFYEDGVSIAERIQEYVAKVRPEKVAKIAIEARMKSKLRHVPLLIVREMARLDDHRKYVKDTLYEVIQRADELAEFVAIYWKDGKEPLSAQVKKGLAKAFTKFDEYALAKYNRDNEVKLRDVLFLCHAKPINKTQARVWKKLVDGTLKTPDTWEVNLSAGKDKKATFTRLIKEEKLGALALLRNLRNMDQAGVNKSLVREALEAMDSKWVLPFRFITAAKYAPRFEDAIESAMMKALKQRTKLKGKTILVVDVSGSMYGGSVSKYSEICRAKVACSLAVLVRELCEEPVIYATAGCDHKRVHKTALAPARRGFGLADAIYKQCQPLGGGGIFLNQVCDYIKKKEEKADRIIVITDEQDCDTDYNRSPSRADAFGKHNYIINVDSYRHGIAYKKWTHISGWSESVLDYIRESERVQQ
jgi:hypothetical protein